MTAANARDPAWAGGVVADGVTDNYNVFLAMLAGLPSGGSIYLPSGIIYLSQKVLIENVPIRVVGDLQTNPLSFGTQIRCAAGGSAFEIRNGVNGRGARSSLERLHIQGQDSAPGANDGVIMRANSAVLRDVVVEGFGGSGVHILSGTDGSPFVGDGTRNANLWRLENVRSYNNKTHGLFVEGVDSSAGEARGLDCTGNTGWGIYDNSAFGNTYYSSHLDGNTAGSIRIGVQSGFNRFHGVYKEGDATPALQIDVGGDEGNIVDFRVLVGNPGETIVDNTAGKGNQILLPGGVPRVRAFNSTTVPMTSGSFTKVTFDSERYDSAAMHSTSSATSRLVAPVPGWYDVAAYLQLAVNATGARYCRLLVNNTTEIARVGPGINAAADDCFFNPKATYFLAATDFVEVEVFQNSGGPLNILKNANYSPEFSMTRVA